MIKQIAALGVAAAAMGYGAQPAEAVDAATECGGKLVRYKAIRAQGGSQPKIGQLEVYYNAGNGNHCAIMYHGGPTWGQRRYTVVWMYPMPRRPSSGPFPAGYVSDGDYYKYQAGPVRVKSRCVNVEGEIEYGGKYYVTSISPTLCS